MNETPIAPKAETPTGQMALVLNPAIEPQRAPVIEAPENPDVIEITISEVDRQTAGRYLDINNCLICTALRNRGFNVLGVGASGASLDSRSFYDFETQQRSGDLHYNTRATSEPFYGPGVVGKVIRLHRYVPSVPSA